MARVTGVGGVFLKSKDPKALKQWYVDNLGIVSSDWGVNFEWSDEVPKGTGSTAWATFPQDTKHFGDSGQTAMINYRVDDLDALVAELETKGVWVDPNRMNEVYGKFAWIKDCDGNKVELWEPIAG
jgi:predicted enzyme related to lactoylglutathione lyase